MHGSAPAAELTVSEPRIEITPLERDADRVELVVVRTAQRPGQIAVVARLDDNGPIACRRAQMRRQIGLQVQRRESAAQKHAQRRTGTGRASLGKLNGVEEFQCTAPETNAALNSETVEGISPWVAAKTCSMSEYRRSMASVVLKVGLPPGMSSEECSMNSM